MTNEKPKVYVMDFLMFPVHEAGDMVFYSPEKKEFGRLDRYEPVPSRGFRTRIAKIDDAPLPEILKENMRRQKPNVAECGGEVYWFDRAVNTYTILKGRGTI